MPGVSSIMRPVTVLVACFSAAHAFDVTSTDSAFGDGKVCRVVGDCVESIYYTDPDILSTVSPFQYQGYLLLLQNGNIDECTITLNDNQIQTLYFSFTGVDHVQASYASFQISNSVQTADDLKQLNLAYSVSTHPIEITWSGPKSFYTDDKKIFGFKVCTEPAGKPNCKPFEYDTSATIRAFSYYDYVPPTTHDNYGCIETIGLGDHGYALTESVEITVTGTVNPIDVLFYGTAQEDTLSVDDSIILSSQQITLLNNLIEWNHRTESIKFHSQQYTLTVRQEIMPFETDDPESVLTYVFPGEYFHTVELKSTNSVCPNGYSPAKTMTFSECRDLTWDVVNSTAFFKSVSYSTTTISRTYGPSYPFFQIDSTNPVLVGCAIANPQINTSPLKATPIIISQPPLHVLNNLENKIRNPSDQKYIVQELPEGTLKYWSETLLVNARAMCIATNPDKNLGGWKLCQKCDPPEVITRPPATPLPTLTPSSTPTSVPSLEPSPAPTDIPTKSPTVAPTRPTDFFQNAPTRYPTLPCDLDSNPKITALDDASAYKSSLLATIARKGQVNGIPVPLYQIPTFQTNYLIKCNAYLGTKNLQIGVIDNAYSDSTCTTTDINIAPWVSTLYDGSNGNFPSCKDADMIDANNYMSYTFGEYTNSKSETLSQTNAGIDYEYEGTTLSFPIDVNEKFLLRSFVFINKLDTVSLQEHIVIPPFRGKPYHPAILPVAEHTLTSGKAYAFHTKDDNNHNADPDRASGWIYIHNNGTARLLNYTGEIAEDIFVGPEEGNLHAEHFTIQIPPPDEAMLKIVTPPGAYDTCSNDNFGPTLTSVPLSQCDGYYEQEPGFNRHGSGHVGVSRYFPELPDAQGAEWFNEQGHFWGGAHLNRDEFEYTWFPGQDFDNHPVARLIMAPHQDFARLGVPPAFIEIKLVFDKCDVEKVKCSIRSHNLVSDPPGPVWWSDFDGEREEVFGDIMTKFRDQPGYSWYKNGVSVRTYLNSNDGLHNEIFFAPYNSPYLLRVSAFAAIKPIDSCDHSNDFGCEPLPYDGWHDKNGNRGCTDYNTDTSLCSRGVNKIDVNKHACQHQSEECSKCYETSAPETPTDICQQCNPLSTTHERVVITGNYFNHDIHPPTLTISNEVCTPGGNVPYDAVAKIQPIGVFQTSVEGVYVKYYLHKDAGLLTFTRVAPAFLDFDTMLTLQTNLRINVTFDCYDGSIRTFPNKCDNQLLGSSITCADMTEAKCKTLEKKSSKCIPPLSVSHNAGSCNDFFDSPDQHCAVCGATNAAPQRTVMQYESRVMPLWALDWPQGTGDGVGSRVDEPFSSASTMLFSDVYQVDDNENSQDNGNIGLLFAPQGIPFSMYYVWGPQCRIKGECTEVTIPEHDLQPRGIPFRAETESLRKCTDTLNQIRIELDTLTGDKTDWVRYDVRIAGSSLTTVNNNYYHSVDEAKLACDALGSTVCYAVGQVKEKIQLYAPDDLGAYPFHDDSDTSDNIYIRQLVLTTDMFHSMCSFNPALTSIVLSHTTPLPIELAVQKGAFNGCAHVETLSLSNIVIPDRLDFERLYFTLSATGISTFTLHYDKNIASKVAENDYFSCPLTGATFSCTVKSIHGATQPVWSTTEIITPMRVSVDDKDNSHETIIIVIVVVAALLTVLGCVLLINRLRHKENTATVTESTPFVNRSV